MLLIGLFSGYFLWVANRESEVIDRNFRFFSATYSLKYIILLIISCHDFSVNGQTCVSHGNKKHPICMVCLVPLYLLSRLWMESEHVCIRVSPKRTSLKCVFLGYFLPMQQIPTVHFQVSMSASSFKIVCRNDCLSFPCYTW
jgi:hypothetical protein